MKSINSWASGVIVAVIVATILEMLLPEGNNKKYIKIIIGIYVLFTIMSPVVEKVLEEDINVESIFASATAYEYSSQQENIDSNKIILNTYVTNLKKDIEEKILSQGYKADEIELKVGDKESNYGKIETIKMILSKIKDENQVEEIKKVDIGISKKKEEKISQGEIEKIRQYLAKTYEIEEKNIIIV